MTPKYTTAIASLLLLSLQLAAAEPQLYETGPEEDAAFVRFVSALNDKLAIRADAGAQVELTADIPATTWNAVRANAPLRARLSSGNHSEEVQVSVQPGEFVTIAALPNNSNWSVNFGRESPDDFNAFRVSLGLLNLDPTCPAASIRLADTDIDIVKNVAPGDIQRRHINPLSLSVELFCSENRMGTAIDLGTLRAGQRWTLLVHSKAQQSALLPILDRLP